MLQIFDALTQMIQSLMFHKTKFHSWVVNINENGIIDCNKNSFELIFE